MKRKILIFAACFGMLAVILGAWSAHGLIKIVNLQKVASFKVGVQYQFLHSFLLLFLALIPTEHWNKKFKISFVLTVIGVILFSGSIYILSLKDVLGIDAVKYVLGPVTPIGGLTLTAAWFFILLGALKIKKVK